MINLARYTAEHLETWNQFVDGSKNGVFLFNRGYMDYHSDRFEDNSLLIYNDSELIGLFPANRNNSELISHGGLTFGGVICGKRMTAVHMLETFEALIQYGNAEGLNSIIYKCVPTFYHRLPAEEDRYALFRVNADRYRCDASSLIELKNRLPYGKGTKASLSKARKNALRVEASVDFVQFMLIQEDILRTKFGTKPTHTAGEIAMLSGRFPENIRLFLVFKENTCLGGTVIFESPTVAHTQYIAITEEGKATGALDCLTDYLLDFYVETKQYFSFGISTVENGRSLNEGLIKNKESFGARMVVLDTYKIALS